jgi:hypothetical protein
MIPIFKATSRVLKYPACCLTVKLAKPDDQFEGDEEEKSPLLKSLTQNDTSYLTVTLRFSYASHERFSHEYNHRNDVV